MQARWIAFALLAPLMFSGASFGDDTPPKPKKKRARKSKKTAEETD